MIKVAPSILSADFTRLGEQVKLVEDAGAEYLHLDIMDGHFVPNISFGPGLVSALRKKSEMIFDVHLMIENPDIYIAEFIAAGADIITVHAESSRHLHRTLQLIKNKGIKAGVSLNPHTSPECLEYIMPMIDLVLVMSVNPGFGGQDFIMESLPKIKRIKQIINSASSNAEIQVDGGITIITAPLVAAAGATVLVAGSAVFNSSDPALAVKQIRRAAESAIK
ncbi:MAG: ribulose-phosphate 3-epimerase [Peptococcaceae bacterium]|nr:ribulose-phosphate 3-epimerase [Peptococcaceae bacterium]